MKAEHTRKVLEGFKQTPVNESLRDLEIFIVQMMNAIIADIEAMEERKTCRCNSCDGTDINKHY